MRRETSEQDRPRARRYPSCAVTLRVAGLLCTVLLSSTAGAQEKTERTGTTLAVLHELQNAFSEVAERVEPAVVTVLSSRVEDNENQRRFSPFRRNPRRAAGTGSGVIIRPEGWVLTNDHVVGGADRVTVRLYDGREFVGKVRRDFRSDLALVKIDSPTPLPCAQLGDSDTVKVGHWAIAIGSPYRYEGSFSVGVISSLNRRQEIQDADNPTRGRFYPSMIQTDAAINPGNSGGPLCNLKGEVIGINTAIESDGGGSIGIGFAIPINAAKFVIDQLLEKGKVSYGYLGVQPTNVTPRLASTLKVERGALIELEPDPGTPAAAAGLQAGDVVIAINDRPVRNELDLRTIVAQTPPGTVIELRIVRDGKEKRLTTTLEEAPDITPQRERPARQPGLGIQVQPLTRELRTRYRLPAEANGVVVRSVEPTSSAYDIEELTEGTLILRINDREIQTTKDFEEATAGLKAGDRVKLLFQTGNIKKFAVVEVN
ncbi:MAG: trypsin-like peptidase domain-containing protein [Chloroherpetonaceae bacterium]|nr:trypsin-like peptidase domain-containing protein [Chthonomonadaceae bacterium]MDW8208885.1 trypsin-like peptidase domain-containing protein [Chloroherpetonaceae bacterium]